MFRQGSRALSNARGFTIDSVPKTAARTPSVDIAAHRDTGPSLWVTVKGYPMMGAYVQARHWFAGALLDIALARPPHYDIHQDHLTGRDFRYATHNVRPRDSYPSQAAPVNDAAVVESRTAAS